MRNPNGADCVVEPIGVSWAGSSVDNGMVFEASIVWLDNAGSGWLAEGFLVSDRDALLIWLSIVTR